MSSQSTTAVVDYITAEDSSDYSQSGGKEFERIPGADENTESEASGDEEEQPSPALPQLVELIPGADEYTSESEASGDEEDQPSPVFPQLVPKVRIQESAQPEILSQKQ